jgi:hypothetical protein
VNVVLSNSLAISSKTKLQERVPLGRTAWKLADVSVLSLLLALVAHRAGSLLGTDDDGAPPPWYRVAALACEAWFTLVWILNMNAKWNPARFDTFPERVAERSVLFSLIWYGVVVCGFSLYERKGCLRFRRSPI